MEIIHGIKEDTWTVCPECELTGFVKLISSFRIVHMGRQVNQYADVKGAKFWRDADGNRHRVTPADGDYKSPTVPSKRKRTDQEVAAIKKRDAQQSKQRRAAASYSRFEQQMRAKRK